MALYPSQIAAAKAYKARKRAAGVVGQPRPTLAKVYARDNGICYLCGGHCSPLGAANQDPHRPTVDHIIALANGGKDTMDNAALACFSCNRRKSTQLVAEYVAQLIELEG